MTEVKNMQPHDAIRPSEGLARWIKDEKREDVFRCYQCLKCSSGCPMAENMDILPSQFIRMVQLGQTEALMKSDTLWFCMSCYTCSVRCPNDIHIVQVIDGVRELALQKGVTPSRRRPALFHRLLLESVRNYGRIYEAQLMATYEAKSGALVKNALVGLALFRKGRFSLLPHKVSDIKGMRETFRRLREAKKR